MMHVTRQDRVFDSVNYLILAIVFLAADYPLYFVVIASVSEPNFTATGRVWLFPRGFSLEGYTLL